MPRRNRPVLTLAVIASLAIVGSAVWYTQFRTPKEITFGESVEGVNLEAIRGVTDTDHIRGNPDAKLVFIVYSDFGCPFCKEFHATMEQLIARYGPSGDVAWVFRQLPLVQLHPQANVYALASECVADKGGNLAFWKFADAMFAAQQPNVDLSANEIVTIAEQSGVPRTTFTECMSSDALQARIDTDFDEARTAGVTGSPFTIIVTPHQRVSFQGARPYIALASATETILRTIGVKVLEKPSAGDSASKQFTQDLSRTVTLPTSNQAPATSTAATTTP